jgi:hypothetical protein
MSRFYNTRVARVRKLGHMEESKTYEGSCHCGAVKFEVTMAPPQKAFAGNCSICMRAGWLLAFASPESFRAIAGEEKLRDYQFGKKSTHHLFCPTCGVRAFSRGKKSNGDEAIAVNLRCIAGLDPTKLEVQTFDCAAI